MVLHQLSICCTGLVLTLNSLSGRLTCALLVRWEELQVLASEPSERHLLFAGDAEDAANGLYSTLSDPVCTATAPGDPAGHTSLPML